VHLLERWSLFLSKQSVICFLVAEFKKDEYTVGRDSNCSLVINDSHLKKVDINLVSKKHFKISHKKDGVHLEGFALTYVNDKKIGPAEKTILKHNDCIAIGRTNLKGM
jgi:pSer/pThr/pTyr-binding forkhead associated (FHA) protein